MELFKINARGTLIQIPIDIAKISEVFKALINNDWKDTREPFYLNYSPDSVHKLLDFINGFGVLTNELKSIIKFLCIDMSALGIQKLSSLKMLLKTELAYVQKIEGILYLEYDYFIDIINKLSTQHHFHLINIMSTATELEISKYSKSYFLNSNDILLRYDETKYYAYCPSDNIRDTQQYLKFNFYYPDSKKNGIIYGIEYTK